MLYHGVELVCPACRSDLTRVGDSTFGVSGVADVSGAGYVSGAGENLLCAGCHRSYPVILGIPDLRLWPDPYISLEDDRAKGRMLEAECRGLDFGSSIELYYRITSAVPPFQARRFARSLLAATERSEAMLHELVQRTRAPVEGTLLDVGCGTAPLAVAAHRDGEHMIGVDVAFRWLVMAKKRLEEHGLPAPLVCACAEALPFRADSFTRVVADSTLEHLRDQQAALNDCFRTLRAGGFIFIATPNRHSLGPDPHTGLPAGGWLPDAVTAAYVRRKGGVPPRRRLLSSRLLRSELERAGFELRFIDVPDIPAAQRARFGRLTRAVIGAYHLVKRLPGGAGVLRAIGPLLHAAARKPSSSPADAAPAVGTVGAAVRGA
jgi:SAM-dependent methyltransferase